MTVVKTNSNGYTLTFTQNAGRFIDQTPARIQYVDTDRLIVEKDDKKTCFEFREDEGKLKCFFGKNVDANTVVTEEQENEFKGIQAAIENSDSFKATKLPDYMNKALNTFAMR